MSESYIRLTNVGKKFQTKTGDVEACVSGKSRGADEVALYLTNLLRGHLTTGEQHLRDAGRGEQPDMPRAAVGHVGEHLQSETG